jgi:GrpB-like predicted nucleotidyltransferase (UPF0157 family)
MDKIFKSAIKPQAHYVDYDPLYPVVAQEIERKIISQRHNLQMEHIGSTAVFGCGGKGILDLLAIYPEGELDSTRDYLLSLGLVKQGPEFKNPWPNHRPMLLGWYPHNGKEYLVYVHVVAQGKPEIQRFLLFRERLSSTPTFLSNYVAEKKRIVDEGVQDTDVYAQLKRPVIHEILGAQHQL